MYVYIKTIDKGLKGGLPCMIKIDVKVVVLYNSIKYIKTVGLSTFYHKVTPKLNINKLILIETLKKVYILSVKNM